MRVVLPCEPAGTAAYDLHPRHENLHKGPAELIRPITLGKIADCDEPLPNGPV